MAHRAGGVREMAAPRGGGDALADALIRDRGVELIGAEKLFDSRVRAGRGR